MIEDAGRIRRRLPAMLLTLLAGGLLLVACGDSDSDDDDVASEEVVDEPGDDADIDGAEPDAEPTESEGTPSASVGDTLTLGGVEVTVVNLIDPATPPVGWVIDGRFLAVEIELSNTSDATLSQPPRGTLIDDDNAQHGPGGGDDLEECQGLGLHDTIVQPGDERAGCLSWDLDEDREVDLVQLDVQGEVGQWQVAP